MPPTLATSFFLPGIISKSPALGISNCSAPHLCPPSSDPESTDLRNMACAELRELWALPLPIRLCLGTEMDGWMVLWEKFLSSNQTLSSLYPAPILAPEWAKCRGWLTGRIWSQTPVWPKPSPAFWPTLECFSVWQRLHTVSPPGLPNA